MISRTNRISAVLFEKLSRLKRRTKQGRFFSVTEYDFSSPQPLFAFVVPKRIYKKSVTRNRIRRRMRAAFKNYVEKKPSLPFRAFVFTATKEDMLQASLLHLTEEFQTLFASYEKHRPLSH